MQRVRFVVVAALLGASGLVSPAAADDTVTSDLTAADAWVDYGRVAQVPVTVVADGATPTGVVTASLGDADLGSAVLDDGAAVIDVPARALLPRAAPYALTVTYAGDDAVAGDSDTVELKVRRGRVFVWATVTPLEPEVRVDRVRAVVEILNNDGVQRAGRVTLSSRNGRGGSSALLQGGRATLRLPPFERTGTKTVVVEYSGSKLLRPATETYEVRVVGR